MTKGVKILIAVVIVAVIAGGTVLLMPKDQSHQRTLSDNNGPQEDKSDSSQADVTVTYDGNTFSLSSSTVKSGGTVKVVNASTKNLDFDSDPHPAHTNNPELNAGGVQPGKSVTFTLEKKGKWGFHNHLNSSQHGELTVE